MTAANLLILINIFVLESLLSIDNAAVLAVMVQDLPFNQRSKALKYGMLGAFGFRGLCLFIATWLIKILWLKIIGGLYLFYLVYGHFAKKEGDGDQAPDKSSNKVYRSIKNGIGVFWSTVILVEIMDLAFSIDNIFAAVAMTDNFTLIIIGVCLGIIGMRFIAQIFTILMQKYPTLENSAFIVILLLGLKLILSGVVDYIPQMADVKTVLSSHLFDLGFSGAMMIIFFVPIMRGKKY